MTWTRAVRDMAWLQARVSVSEATGCWEWKLARNRLGYGSYGDNTGPKHVTRKAHRLAFELANGYLPSAVLHRCDNPPCCNPAHLFAGTLSDNVQDMLTKGRGGVAVLTWAQANEIRSALAAGAQGRRLAVIYGVTEHAISKIKRGKTWRTGDAPPAARTTCQICGQNLAPGRLPNTIYCSNRCAGAAYRRRQGQKPRARRSLVSE